MGKLYNIFRYKQLTKFLTLLFVLCFNYSWGQIAVQDFESTPASPAWAICTGASFISSVTGTGDTPANQRIRNGSRSWQTNNKTNTLDLCAVSVVGCSSVQVVIYISSTSVSSGNGADGTDFIKVSANVDGAGFPATPDITVYGNNNSRWGYNTSGIATSAGTPVTGTGTSGTNTGTIYSKLVLNIPNGSSSVALKIIASNNDANEIWCVDDIQITGSCCSAPSTSITPTTQTICISAATTISASSSAVSNTYTWQASSNGTSGWINVVNGIPPSTSYTGENTATLSIIAGSTYYYQCLVTDITTSCTATSGTSTLVVNSFPIISSQPISVSTTSTGTASYTVIVPGSGSAYQWQENSGLGFSNISNGGSNPTYAGSTNSVLTISNPPLSMSGYSYQCIVTNACGTATTNGTSTITITTSLTCPYLVSAVINACDGCADEGNNEFLVVNTGSYAFNVNSTNVKITYSNGPTNITSSFAAQPTSLATLNTTTINTCGTTFVDVSNGAITVPTNSTLFIMNKGACFTGDWSAYCGLGTVYVAFSATTAWITAGFFGNNTTNRTFVTDFSAVNSSCGSTTYAYNQTGIAGTPNGFNSDGASVLFNGNNPPTYINGNGNCSPPNIILPINLFDFYAIQNDNNNNLIWKVASEKNVSQYIIEKSEDGINFTELTKVAAKAKDGVGITYSCEDNSPYTGITYYRLNTIEIDGELNHNKIIYLDRATHDWKSIIYQQDNFLYLEFKNSIPKNSTISLFDLSGKLLADKSITESQTKINTQNFAEGIYFLRISSPYKIENFKLIIQK